MKNGLHTALAMLLAIGTSASPTLAKTQQNQTRYEHNGQYYNSLRECQNRKNKSTKDGTIVGAAVAGVGAAVLGANLGQTALIAGGGALVGNQIGKTKKC